MKPFYKTSISIALIALISGCSGKSFSMQEYADRWFNDKEKPKQNPTSSELKDNETVTQFQENDTSKMTETVKIESTKIEKTNTKISVKSQPKKISPNKVEGAAIRKGVPASVAWSSMDKHKDGQMQHSLDKWTKEEWNPAFENDDEQAKKDENTSQHFTLQHYMDKRAQYLKSEEERIKASGKPRPEANYEKMDKLPVIGKERKSLSTDLADSTD